MKVLTQPNAQLISQLQDALAFETTLVELISEHVSACQGSTRRLYREHARVTRLQVERLRARLAEFSAPLSAENRGEFSRRLDRLSAKVESMEVWRDEATQLLITSYGIKQLECTMYRGLLALAEQHGDVRTAALARTCLSEEESTARRLLFCIGEATRSAVA